jgi:uncharacterized protein
MRNDINQLQNNLTALVTGASSGIGSALARVLAKNGHNLVLTARNQNRLDQLAGELHDEFGAAIKVIPKDLSIRASAQEIFAELQRESIKVSLLVNNAGFDVYGYFTRTDLAKELEMIQVNLVSLTELTKLVLIDMVNQKYGRVLNIASTGALIPSPLNAVYSATKAYVVNFSEAIAEELRGSGVTVTALCPGSTKTEFHQRAGIRDIPLDKFGSMKAEAVAEIGYRSMMAGKRVAIPGLNNQMLMLAARFLPISFQTRMARAMLEGQPPQPPKDAQPDSTVS